MRSRPLTQQELHSRAHLAIFMSPKVLQHGLPEESSGARVVFHHPEKKTKKLSLSVDECFGMGEPSNVGISSRRNDTLYSGRRRKSPPKKDSFGAHAKTSTKSLSPMLWQDKVFERVGCKIVSNLIKGKDFIVFCVGAQETCKSFTIAGHFFLKQGRGMAQGTSSAHLPRSFSLLGLAPRCKHSF